MPEPAQPSTGTDPSNPPSKDPKSTPAPAATPPASVDVTKLTGDDLTKVLENPELFKIPRIADALQAQKDLKKLQDANSKAAEDKLIEDKKFEELSQNQSKTNEQLQK